MICNVLGVNGMKSLINYGSYNESDGCYAGVYPGYTVVETLLGNVVQDFLAKDDMFTKAFMLKSKIEHVYNISGDYCDALIQKDEYLEKLIYHQKYKSSNLGIRNVRFVFHASTRILEMHIEVTTEFLMLKEMIGFLNFDLSLVDDIDMYYSFLNCSLMKFHSVLNKLKRNSHICTKCILDVIDYSDLHKQRSIKDKLYISSNMHFDISMQRFKNLKSLNDCYKIQDISNFSRNKIHIHNIKRLHISNLYLFKIDDFDSFCIILNSNEEEASIYGNTNVDYDGFFKFTNKVYSVFGDVSLYSQNEKGENSINRLFISENPKNAINKS